MKAGQHADTVAALEAGYKCAVALLDDLEHLYLMYSATRTP